MLEMHRVPVPAMCNTVTEQLLNVHLFCRQSRASDDADVKKNLVTNGKISESSTPDGLLSSVPVLGYVQKKLKRFHYIDRDDRRLSIVESGIYSY